MPKRLTRGKERLRDRKDLKSESSNFFPSGIACCKDLVLSSSCCSKRQLKHISEDKGVLKLASRELTHTSVKKTVLHMCDLSHTALVK